MILLSQDATTAFGKAGTAMTTLQGKSSTLSTTVATHMKSMTTHVQNFSSAAVKAFDAVGKAADANAKKVAALQKAIDALKSKTITITVNYKVNKPAGLQHGGAFIANSPMQIDGVNIAEHSKPELVSVLPLTNPNDLTDKTIDIPMPSLKTPQIKMPHSTGGGGGQPINVHGEIHITNTLGDGRVITEIIKPFLLKNYSGITSS